MAVTGNHNSVDYIAGHHAGHNPGQHVGHQPGLYAENSAGKKMEQHAFLTGHVDNENGSTPKRNVPNLSKKIFKFMFSHIGLTAMVTLYVVAGGFVFSDLEEYNEKQTCEKRQVLYAPVENETTRKLWEIWQRYQNDIDPSSAVAEFKKIVQRFRDKALTVKYSGSNCSAYGETDGPQYSWSFPNALLFSVTVVTTIGYGNIAPSTRAGRLVFLAYALFGIPLMMIFLANIGDVLADVVRFTYTKLCCCGCLRRKRKKEGPEDNQHVRPSSAEAWKEQYGTGQKMPMVVDDLEEEEEVDEEKVSVPLTVIILIIAMYIYCGALMFANWDTWDPFKASYYCFITVSTIGFGDVTPNTENMNQISQRLKLFGASFYIVLGMATLSMCFNLIQDQISEKFRWLGQKFGIVDKEQDEDNDEEEEDEEEEDEPDTRDTNPLKESAVRQGTTVSQSKVPLTFVGGEGGSDIAMVHHGVTKQKPFI